MKFLVAIFMVTTMVGSAFAGEFSNVEYHKIMKNKDYNALIAYMENATFSSKKENDFYAFCLAKIIAGYKKGEITQATLAEKCLTLPDGFTNDKQLALNGKLFLMSHAAWWCGINNFLNDTFKKLYESNSKYFDNLDSVTLNACLENGFYKLKEYDKCVEFALKSKRYFQAFYVSAFFNKSTIDTTLEALINNPDTVTKPVILERIIKGIGQLSNPKYDEKVKTLLIVLNRNCYPKLQYGEDWKKVIVQLQLVMKSYGI